MKPGEALDRALARRGKTRIDLPPNTNMGKAVRRHGVMATPEFKRIDELPRRRWNEDPELEETIELLTEHLRVPGGEQRLRPVQAVAIKEAHDCGGLIGGLRTGDGKTLCSFEVSVFCDFARPVLFVPSKLREKTDHDLRAAAKHWRVPEHLQILSYEDLSNVKWCDWLMRYQPDAIIGDEAHKWKHDDTARTLRLERFLDEFPHTPMILFSGTFIRKELWDIQRLCERALHDRSPVPRNWKDCSDWCSALDHRAKTKLAPGALGKWCTPDELKSLDGVKAAVGRRLCESPGVVISFGESVSCSLQLEGKIIDHPQCEQNMERLHVLGEKPDGWKAVDAPTRWMVKQCLALGFFHIMDPYPPKEWAEAKREWDSFCAEAIKDRSNELDSQLQVYMACERSGETLPIFERWRAVKDSFTPSQQSIWFSSLMVDRAAAWLEKHKGICWTPFPEFGDRLSDLTGIPFYHHNGRDAQGNSIVHAKAGPIIASTNTCDEGLNLQDRWHQNLYVCPMSDGSKWEQTLARTHRIYQLKDEVTAEVWIAARVNHENLWNAIEAERGVAKLTQEPFRKLCVADLIIPPLPKSRAYRWR